MIYEAEEQLQCTRMTSPLLCPMKSSYLVQKTPSKLYEAVAEAKVNQDKSVGLQHGTKKSKSTPSNNVVGRGMEGPIKMLRFWFVPDL